MSKFRVSEQGRGRLQLRTQPVHLNTTVRMRADNGAPMRQILLSEVGVIAGGIDLFSVRTQLELRTTGREPRLGAGPHLYERIRNDCPSSICAINGELQQPAENFRVVSLPGRRAGSGHSDGPDLSSSQIRNNIHLGCDRSRAIAARNGLRSHWISGLSEDRDQSLAGSRSDAGSNRCVSRWEMTWTSYECKLFLLSFCLPARWSGPAMRRPTQVEMRLGTHGRARDAAFPGPSARGHCLPFQST